jgi:hypothetical protein
MIQDIFAEFWNAVMNDYPWVLYATIAFLILGAPFFRK